MEEFQHMVLRGDRYCVLARTWRPQYTTEAISGYTVATLAGDRLRDEPTLALARAWMEEHERIERRERASQTISCSRPVRRR